MALVVVLGLLLILVTLPVVRAFTNPIVTVADDLDTTAPYADVDAALAKLVGGTRGYDVQMPVPGTYTLSHRRSPAWALVLGLVTFPAGILIIWLAREQLTLTLSATATDSGTRVLALGRVHRKLARTAGAAVTHRLARLEGTAADVVQPHLR
jgi:hypothetical protein